MPMFKKMFKGAAVLAVTGSALLTGCGADMQSDELNEQDEIVANVIEAGFPADDVLLADGKVYVGRDAHVTLEASREMAELAKQGLEHYRTTNRVTVTTICVNPTSAFTSYSRLNTGLTNAINNYNALGLTIRLQRGGSGCQATITAQTTSGTGGSAGFPSGGRPYGTINIGTGLQSYAQGVSTHVIAHEIGHALGLRHTDYFNRSISCGGAAQNEGTAGVGAIHIAGTPTTNVTSTTSIMNSCFSSSSTGVFTASDRTALNWLF